MGQLKVMTTQEVADYLGIAFGQVSGSSRNMGLRRVGSAPKSGGPGRPQALWDTESVVRYANNRRYIHVPGLHSCRCRGCLSSSKHIVKYRKYARRINLRRNSRNAQFRQVAHNHYRRWTGPELEIAMRTDLSCADAAKLLGRTIRSVENVRAKVRSEPNWNIRAFGRVA